MKSFLVTSSATFVGIVAADHASRNFELGRSADLQYLESREEKKRREEAHELSVSERVFRYLRQEKYKVVGVTWLASMVGSFWLVGRNPYLSGQQKIVQARVYAQGLTLAVLVASAGFEISDQKRVKKLLEESRKARKEKGIADKPAEEEEEESGGDENSDMWKDMVAAEEQRLKAQHKNLYEPHEAQAENKEAD